MSPVILGQDYDVSHTRGCGHWWMPETLYLQTLMCDPFVLTRTRRLPAVILPSQRLEPTDQTLLITTQPPLSTREADHIRAVIDAAGAVILNRPNAALLQSLPSFDWAHITQAPLESLRERWDLNSPRSYSFADQQSYDCYDPDRGQVLSWIGEHPDLIFRGRTALSAGNPWPTVLGYLNSPSFSRLLLDLSELFIHLIGQFTQRRVNSDEQERIKACSELRRDFHAFGFAAFTIQQLQRCLDVSRIDLQNAEATAVQAADTLALGNVAESQNLLTTAFRLLEKENRKLQAEPAIFTDTLHGGGLFSDIGFCEFDWPQHAADVLSNHLEWVERRSYRLNLDFAAKSLQHMSQRFPKLFARLRAAQSAGGIEIVNGTWNQPYPPFFSLESMIRQFDLGNRTIAEILGRRADTYASQEFAFTPQTASILAQFGFRHAVLRVQNMGDVPSRSEQLVQWTAPNGDHVLALPSHTYKSEQRNEVTYNNLHLKLFAAAEKTPKPHVFTGLGDITYYRPFREELARTAHYANVFGRFSTWSEYFSAARPIAPPKVQMTMEDFDCRAAFLEVGVWDHLRLTGGGSIAHCMRSSAASELFRATDLLQVLSTWCGEKTAFCSDENWKALATFQGHDRYFSPDWPSGGFMSGANNPMRRQGRTTSTVADYCGPIDTRTFRQQADSALLVAERNARRSIARQLRRFPRGSATEPAWVLFNPGPAHQRVFRFRHAAGRSVQVAGQDVAAQDDGDDLLALVPLPAYSCSLANVEAGRARPPIPVQTRVQCGEDYIDNGLLRIEFDRHSGTISRMLRPSDGKLLLVDSHTFCAPGSVAQRCEKFHWRLRGPLVAAVDLILTIQLPGERQCRIRSRWSLEASQTWLDMRHRVLACPPFRGDQWQEHLGLKFMMPDDSFTLHRSHYNVLEEARGNRIFSYNLLLAESNGTRIGWANRGNQFYVRDGRSISAMLICENETARSFAHRVGYATENPLSEARAWLSPVFRTHLRGAAAAPGESTVSVRALELSSKEVELLSLSRQRDGLRARLANLSDKSTSTRVRLTPGSVAAWASDFIGERRVALAVEDGWAAIELRPWDLVQIEMT